MQTIALKSRVSVLSKFRYKRANDDNYWTGTVVSYNSNFCEYAVVFTDFSKDWFTAEQLCVIES